MHRVIINHPVNFPKEKELYHSESIVENNDNTNIRGNSALNIKFQQSQKPLPLAEESLTENRGASADVNKFRVQKTNLEKRARDLKNYMETTVTKDPGITSENKKSFNARIDYLLKEIENWDDSNGREQSQKVEELLYKMQLIPRHWKINYRESQKSEIGVLTRLEDLRSVRDILYVSGVIADDEMVSRGMKILEDDISVKISKLKKYVRENLYLATNEKNFLQGEIEGLERLVRNTASQRSRIWQFRINLFYLKDKALSIVQSQKCDMLRSVDGAQGRPINEIIQDSLAEIISLIYKIRFPGIVQTVLITPSRATIYTLIDDENNVIVWRGDPIPAKVEVISQGD